MWYVRKKDDFYIPEDDDILDSGDTFALRFAVPRDLVGEHKAVKVIDLWNPRQNVDDRVKCMILKALENEADAYIKIRGSACCQSNILPTCVGLGK